MILIFLSDVSDFASRFGRIAQFQPPLGGEKIMAVRRLDLFHQHEFDTLQTAQFQGIP
jgi:hypothetical protein